MDKEISRIFLRFVVLKIIREQPIHGYDIIKKMAERSEGRWTPSAGSIYPILEQYEKSGCIRSEVADRKKVYSITPQGERALERMTEKKIKLIEEMTQVVREATGETGENELGR